MRSITKELPSSPAFTLKGPKHQPSRWMSDVETATYWLPHLSSRLLALLYIGLQEGYLTKASTHTPLLPLPEVNVAEDPAKEAVSKSASAQTTE